MPTPYSSTMLTPAIPYPLSTFAPKYVGTRSGVSRSCRTQPIERSSAIRAPPAITAAIAPHATMPTM